MLPHSRRTKLNIVESPEKLLELLSEQVNRYSYQKVKLLYLLKTEKAKTFVEIAKIVGIHPVTTGKWIKKYEEEGLEEFLKVPISTRGLVPDWAIERLLEELKDAQFFPSIDAVHIWLLTVGIPVCRDKAAQVRSSTIPQWKLRRQQSEDQLVKTGKNSRSDELLIEPVNYQYYQDWKEERGITDDAHALHQLMLEYFCLTSIQKDKHELSLDSSPSDSDELKSNDSETSVPEFLNQSNLAKRLKVTDSVLSKNRCKQSFSRWAKQKDPDRLEWVWISNQRRYQSLCDVQD